MSCHADAAAKAFSFQSRGMSLCAWHWPSRGRPARSVVVLIHGWGDHALRYAGLAEVLAAQGHAVYALEFEGHGRSSGAHRAHIRRFDDLVADLAAFVLLVSGHHAGKPLFLCGYSMGGCVAAHLLAFRPEDAQGVTGAVFNASALTVSQDIPWIKRALSWVLGGALPRLPISVLTYGALMSRDPAEVESYDQDPWLYHGKINAGTGRQLLQANHRIGRHLDRIRVPFLVIQGLADTLVAPQGALALHQQAASADKQLVTYEGALHDLLHETHKDEVMGDITSWLDLRTRDAGPGTGSRHGCWPHRSTT